MSEQLLQVQARARALARSGTFVGWRAIAFELSFEPNYREARDWLKEPSTRDELEAVVDSVPAKNPKAVDDYHAGKPSAVQFLVGQVMRRTKGRAKPDVVQPILLSKLGSP